MGDNVKAVAKAVDAGLQRKASAELRQARNLLIKPKEVYNQIPEPRGTLISMVCAACVIDLLVDMEQEVGNTIFAAGIVEELGDRARALRMMTPKFWAGMSA